MRDSVISFIAFNLTSVNKEDKGIVPLLVVHCKPVVGKSQLKPFRWRMRAAVGPAALRLVGVSTRKLTSETSHGNGADNGSNLLIKASVLFLAMKVYTPQSSLSDKLWDNKDGNGIGLVGSGFIVTLTFL